MASEENGRSGRSGAARAGWPDRAAKGASVKGFRARLSARQKPEDTRTARPDKLLHLRGGGVLVLRKARDRGGIVLDRRRPRYWRSLASVLSPGERVPERRLNGWLLVLEAKKIPYVFVSGGAYPSLYVSPMREGVAAHEILAFERERPVPIFVPPARDNIAGVLLFLFLLVIWHGLRWGWLPIHLPAPLFPSNPGEWAGRFGLDVYRTRVLHEWWRAVTALGLHADDPHLFSNMVFGLLFFIPLCRRAGLGLGIALAVASGALGNVVNALTREAHVVSLGFSTALFGAVGSLCMLNAADVVRHFFRFAPRDISNGTDGAMPGLGLVFALARRLGIPLAAGMALLGILGGGGEVRTDYAAHIWGFCCGVLCTLAALPLERAIFSRETARQTTVQAALFLTTLAAVAGFWLYAVCK